MNWYGYIYKTVNLLNGKIYIGRKKGPFDRSYHGSGMIIKRAIHLHGRHFFKTEVLSFASDFNELCEMERHHIRALRQSVPMEMIYNISDGGKGGFTGGHHSNNVKAKWRIERSGRSNPMYGIRLTGSLNPRFKKPVSAETRNKISDGNKGNHSNLGAVRSFETRLKISQSKKGSMPWNKGRPWTDTERTKLSDSAMNRKIERFRDARGCYR